MRRLWFMVAMMALGAGCRPSPATPQGRAAINDEKLAALLDGGQAVEARMWLDPQSTGHYSDKLSKEELSELVGQLYSAGAKTVWAAEIRHEPGKDLCGSLIVQMPDDPPARQALMKLDDKLEDQPTPTTDYGAKYFRIGLEAD